MAAFSLVVFITGVVIPAEAYYRDFLVWDSKQVKEYDAHRLSIEAVQTNYDDGIQPLRITENEAERTYITFEPEEGDFFNVQNIQEMYEVEQVVLSHPDFSNFCLANSSLDKS